MLKANAKLIAAAPEMLKEIDSMIDALDPDMKWHKICWLRDNLVQFRSKIFEDMQ